MVAAGAAGAETVPEPGGYRMEEYRAPVPTTLSGAKVVDTAGAPALWQAGATAFLDHFTCNKLPNVGRINLTYALTATGTTRTEYTIVRFAENEYYLVSAGAWTAYDADFLHKAAEDFIAAGGGHLDIHDIQQSLRQKNSTGCPVSPPVACASPARK